MFGRDDALSKALSMGAWPKFDFGPAHEHEARSSRAFSGSTRYANYSEARADVKLPELYESKDQCCGCGACASKCPAAAISMFPDEEGFLYPIVDASKCLGCGACLQVCPLK